MIDAESAKIFSSPSNGTPKTVETYESFRAIDSDTGRISPYFARHKTSPETGRCIDESDDNEDIPCRVGSRLFGIIGWPGGCIQVKINPSEPVRTRYNASFH